SFVLSQTLVPTMCAKWLPAREVVGDESAPQGWGPRLHARVEMVLYFLTRHYQRLLAFALVRRASVLVAVALLFVASLGLLFFIGREFFPQVDAGQLTVFVRSPSGTNIEATEQRIIEVEKFLEASIPASERQMIIAE